MWRRASSYVGFESAGSRGAASGRPTARGAGDRSDLRGLGSTFGFELGYIELECASGGGAMHGGGV